MAEVKLTKVIERPTSISREFEFVATPPVIGRIVMRGVEVDIAESGTVETSRPFPAEIPIAKPIGRPIETAKLMDDEQCVLLVTATLQNSRYFDGLL